MGEQSHEINLPADPPAKILRDLADRFERGECRSFYLCAVSKDGKAGSMIFTPDRWHYAQDLSAIGESAVELCDKIDASLTPKLPGVA
jgi:hypothetical protein